MEQKMITRSAKVPFTDPEKLEMASKIGRETQLLAEARERKKEVSAQLNADVECHRTEVDRIGTALANGYEYRPVECVQVSDFERATVRVTRCDTGEIIEDRPMTPSERQREIALVEREGGE